MLSASPKLSSRSEQSSFELDVALVLGDGPNIPVLLPDEATPVQKEQWYVYTSDPTHQHQPDFYLLTGHQYTEAIEKIHHDASLHESEKTKHIESLRQKWQHNGEFALRKIGKLNALAAGDALYTGKVGMLILTGGRTMPKWQKDKIKRQYLTLYPEKAELSDDELESALKKFIVTVIKWPSEAALMQDIIISEYGWKFFSKEYSQERLHKLYEERFGAPVDERTHDDYKAFEKRVYDLFIQETLLPRLLLEEESMNTLDNIVFSMNNYPELLKRNQSVGLFASDWQRSRALLLAERFLLHVEKDAGISSQKYLKERAQKRRKIRELQLMNTLLNKENKPVSELHAHNERLEKGLTDEEYANYWAGWLFKIQDPQMLVDVLHQFNNQSWIDAMSDEFRKVGLNFEKLQEMDLITLAEEDPLAYQQIIDKGLALTKPKLRSILPPLHEMKP